MESNLTSSGETQYVISSWYCRTSSFVADESVGAVSVSSVVSSSFRGRLKRGAGGGIRMKSSMVGASVRSGATRGERRR